MATIPRRPVAKPVARPAMAPKPVAKPAMAPAAKPSANPFTGGKTTTLAQRQAYQPFRSATKPAQPKINPLQQATSPQPRPDLPPGAQMRKPMLGAQPMTSQGGVLVNGQPFNPKPGTNQGMLPNVQQPAPQIGNFVPEGGFGFPGSQPTTPIIGGGVYNPGQSPMGEPTLPYMGGLFGPGGTLGGQQLGQVQQNIQGDPGFNAGPSYGGGKSAVDQPANYNNGYQVGGDINIDPATGQPTPYQPDSMSMDQYAAAFGIPSTGNQPNSYNGQLDLSGMMGQQGQQQAVPQNMYGTQPSATPGGKSTGSSSSNASYGGGKSQ